MIHIESVADPIRSNPKLLYHAVMVVQRADGMGLMRSGYVVKQLGIEALREIAERAARLGVGGNAAAALKGPVRPEPKWLEQVLEHFNTAFRNPPYLLPSGAASSQFSASKQLFASLEFRR